MAGIASSTVGETLRGLRQQAKLSGRDLAKRSGISQAKISKIECSRIVPSIADIRALAEALQLSPFITKTIEHRLKATKQTEKFSHFTEYCQHELNARQIDGFVNSVFPALVQTPEYTAHLLATVCPSEQLASALRSRLQRQMQLFDSRKRIRLLMTTGALCHLQQSLPVLWNSQMENLKTIIKYATAQFRILDDVDAASFGLLATTVIHDETRVFFDTMDGQAIRYDDYDARRNQLLFEKAWGSASRLTESRIEQLQRAASPNEILIQEIITI